MYFIEREVSTVESASRRQRSLNALYPMSAGFDLPEDFSEISRATLEDLLGGESYGPSYSMLYHTSPSKQTQMDVGRAMGCLRGTISRGHFDFVTVRILGDIFQRFVADGDSKKKQKESPDALRKSASPRFELSGKNKIKGAPAKELSFEQFQSFYFSAFLIYGEKSDLQLDFRLLGGKSPVELRLEIGAGGSPVWELRGTSSLKKSHMALRDQLFAATSDFKERLKWMEEYENLSKRATFQPTDYRGTMEDLELICRVDADLLLIQSGTIASLPLMDVGGEILFERCLDCDRAVMPVARYEGSYSARTVNRIEEIADRVGENLRKIHDASGCAGLLATWSQPGATFSVIG